MNKSSSSSLAFIFFSASALIFSGACSPNFGPSSQNVGEKIGENLGCSSFEESFWKSMYESVEKNGEPPSGEAVSSSLKLRFKKSDRLSKISTDDQDKIVSLASEIADTIRLRTESTSPTESAATEDIDQKKGLWLERLAQLEIGDRTTSEKSGDVDRIRQMMTEMKTLAAAENLEALGCPSADPATPSQSPSNPISDGWKSKYATPVVGGLRIFATLYQSCEAATRAPLGNEVEDVRGISVTGRHSSGSGNVRVISDRKALINSHPYLGPAIYKRPLPSCHDVQASPPIYDYGGKPFTSTANEKLMDLFKNGGTGSQELGIDCSAMVFAAYTTVGLKLKKETSLKATLVNGVSSSMLAEPQKNGLTCLDHASFTAAENLVAGDIISIKGHVVLVADVGTDPLGISSFQSRSECKASNMSVAQFNFSIFHSSPSKGAIGMNRMRARDYLSGFSTMGRGMIDHAVNACKAKFQTKPLISKSSKASVVRHSGSSDCIDPVPISLAKEDCLSSCAPRSLDPL